MVTITQSHRYIQAVQLKPINVFQSEQIFMTILLDSNASLQERIDAAHQIFDIAMRDRNPSYGMYILELIMDLQSIKLSDLGLYPQYTQLLSIIEARYPIRLSTMRSFEQLLALQEREFTGRRLLLFLICIKPFLNSKLQEHVEYLIEKTQNLQDTFAHTTPVLV